MTLYYGTPIRSVLVDHLTVGDIYFVMEDLFNNDLETFDSLLLSSVEKLPFSTINNLAYLIHQNDLEMYNYFDESFKKEPIISLLDKKFMSIITPEID
jgi:hypothetical protein